jgi:hypothetical protein
MKTYTATAGMLCLVALTTGACVMRSTYEAAVADLEATNAEVGRTRTQSQALTEQVSELQQIKANLARQIEAASSAVQEAKQEMETEQTTLQERLSKLNRTISQLIAQQNNLRSAIQRAKEERPALQSSVERYKSSMGDGDGPRAPRFPAPGASTSEQDPIALTPSAQVPAPNNPASNGTLTAPAVPVDPAAAAPQSRSANKQTPEPVEEGWLSALKGWVLSIWHSIFS